MAHIAVNSMNNIFRRQIRNLRVVRDNDVGERLDKVFPFLFDDTPDRLCTLMSHKTSLLCMSKPTMHLEPSNVSDITSMRRSAGDIPLSVIALKLCQL